MDFSYSDEQHMLADTTRRFASQRYAFEHRLRVRDSEAGWCRDTWIQLAELGLLGINIPETDGGLGFGPVETMLVSRVIGEAMLLEPYLQSAVVATRAIVELGSKAQRAQWLPELSSGELIAVLAHAEDGAGDDRMQIATQAHKNADGWRLDGHKQLTYHAPAAGLLLVSARTADDEIGLFALPADAPGLQLAAHRSVDDQCAAELHLDGVQVGISARIGKDATAGLRNAMDAGLAALCAEALGAMEKAVNATIEYTRSRQQFGVPIGRFQALQHRMADMFMRLEEARSMACLASSACTDPDLATRQRDLYAAKALMGQCARFIGQQAVQLHGGMGMTDELDISHYFKRLTAFEYRGISTDQALQRYQPGSMD